MTNKLKCETCKNLKYVEENWYCTKSNHRLENGYAMQWHSRYCNGCEPKQRLKNKLT